MLFFAFACLVRPRKKGSCFHLLVIWFCDRQFMQSTRRVFPEGKSRKGLFRGLRENFVPLLLFHFQVFFVSLSSTFKYVVCVVFSWARSRCYEGKTGKPLRSHLCLLLWVQSFCFRWDNYALPTLVVCCVDGSPVLRQKWSQGSGCQLHRLSLRVDIFAASTGAAAFIHLIVADACFCFLGGSVR